MGMFGRNRVFSQQIAALSLFAVLFLGIAWLCYNDGVISKVFDATGHSYSDFERSEQLEFIETAFTTFSTWDPSLIKPLMADVTRAQFSDAELEQIIRTLDSSLGTLICYTSPTFIADNAAESGQVSPEQSFRFVAHYEKGTADISLQLIKGQADWELLAINIFVRAENSISA